MTRSLFALAALTMVGCGMGAGPGSDAGGASTDAAAGTDASRVDASGTDSASRDGGAASDSGTSIDSGVPTSHPPAGYTQCGAGMFSAMDVVTACESTPGISGALPYPVDCTGATATGGRYEVWCPPDGGTYVYFWAVLNGVTAPRRSCSLPLPDGGAAMFTTSSEIYGARFVGGTGARGAAGDFMGSPTFLDLATSVVVQGDASFGGAVGPSGTLNVWIALTPGDCPGTTGGPMLRYVMGVAATWSRPDV